MVKYLYLRLNFGFNGKIVRLQVLTTDPKKYAVRWPRGVILPNSTCEVIGGCNFHS